MTQFRRILNLTAVLGLLALPALAQDRAPIARAEGRAFPFLRCLRAADLSDSQKADIKAIMEAAKPLLQASHEKIQADRQKLHADLEAGADKSVVGQDVINLHADMKAARAELESIKDQVLSKLTAEQKAKVADCFEGHKGANMREGHFDGHFDGPFD